jgi:UPF0042 nucleotide-binding protein
MAARRSPAPPDGRRPRFLVVTGLSGAGKSHAIHALEDLGFFCVDNLPVALIPTFADLTAGQSRVPAAVVVDVREGAGLAVFPQVYGRLKRRPGLDPKLLFLDAHDQTLLTRFSETRRPHPLAPNRSAAEGLREERRRLEPMRRLADRVIDSSGLSVHELRRRVMAFATGDRAPQPLAVTIVSFGFKHGVPADADLVFDVRFLPNPHFVANLRHLSGLDARARRFIMKGSAGPEFLRRTASLLRFLLPHYLAEGKSYLTVALGCTGGRHRSVALAELLARRLRGVRGADVRVRHRDIDEEGPVPAAVPAGRGARGRRAATARRRGPGGTPERP